MDTTPTKTSLAIEVNFLCERSIPATRVVVALSAILGLLRYASNPAAVRSAIANSYGDRETNFLALVI